MIQGKGLTKYMIYAVGEIILVVIGILIALWFNGQSEDRKLVEDTRITAQAVLEQLEKDVKEIDSMFVDWQFERKVSDTILRLTKRGEPISRDCIYCPNLITGASVPTITDRVTSKVSNSKLAEGDIRNTLVDIEFHYIEGAKMAKFHEDAVIEFTKSTLKYWLDNYAWFADITARGRCDEDCLTYFYESEDYRNKTAYYELILLESYYDQLEVFNETNKDFIEKLQDLLILN